MTTVKLPRKIFCSKLVAKNLLCSLKIMQLWVTILTKILMELAAAKTRKRINKSQRENSLTKKLKKSRILL
jgi:hypothetical protein